MDTAAVWNGEEEEKVLVSKRRLTICVVGSGGVGKSSLVTRYLHGHFPEASTYINILGIKFYFS